MSRATWDEILAAAEARLAAAEAVAAGTAGPVAPFTEPVIAEPLPARLVGRAEAIVARSAELEARLQAQAEGIRADWRRLPRSVNRTTTGGSSLFEIGA